MKRFTVQAVYLMRSGRVHKMLPVQLDGDAAVAEYERKVKYSLVQSEYLIEDRNERNHAMCIRPTDVESSVVDIKGYTEVADFEEPAYDELRAKWEEALKAPEEDAAPDPQSEPVIVPVEPADPEGVVSVVSKDVAEVEINSETTQSIKMPKTVTWNVKPPVPEQRVQWPDSAEPDTEKTQPMTVLKAEEVRAMENGGMSEEDATDMLQRVADGLKEEETPPRKRATPPAARRRAASRSRGKTTQPPK